MKSLRTFLVIMIVSVVCLTNFSAALQGYRDSSQAADKLIEHQVLEKVETLTALLASRVDIPANLFPADSLYQVWQDGELLYKSANAPDSLFVAVNGQFHFNSYQRERWFGVGQNFEKGGIQLVVATRYLLYSDLTEEILIRAIIPIIWILPVVGLLVWIVVNIGLRPLKRLAGSLSVRDANNFALIRDERYTRELTPIVQALNSLFSRLSEAFDRERRFSADAAHELRTPLAALKVNLHNLSRSMQDSGDLEGLKRTTERMEHSIEQLLAMHRASMSAGAMQLERCDLYKIAQTVIADLYDTIDARQQQIELKGESTPVMAENSSLSILLRNLIDNASKYTPHQGTIWLSVESRDHHVRLLIEDSGPGIDESEYGKVLEPFYRVGGDQHKSKVLGSGLGLSIVAFVTQLYQGEIYLSRSVQLGGLAIEILFPAIDEDER